MLNIFTFQLLLTAASLAAIQMQASFNLHLICRDNLMTVNVTPVALITSFMYNYFTATCQQGEQSYETPTTDVSWINNCHSLLNSISVCMV